MLVKVRVNDGKHIKPILTKTLYQQPSFQGRNELYKLVYRVQR